MNLTIQNIEILLLFCPTSPHLLSLFILFHSHDLTLLFIYSHTYLSFQIQSTFFCLSNLSSQTRVYSTSIVLQHQHLILNVKYLTFGTPNIRKAHSLDVLNFKTFSMNEPYSFKFGMILFINCKNFIVFFLIIFFLLS